MHCHVYTKGVGKKGANNVASLIMKTLQKQNFLCKDSVGGELNIIFDNCFGQNKNTVLKLPAWLMAMGYFKEIHFIFLVVSHTKNAADHLFNLLMKEYAQAERVSAGFRVDLELASDLSRGIRVSEMAECWEKVQCTSVRPHVDLVPGGNGTGMRLTRADT